VPENRSLVFLPPSSPKLNPLEQLWLHPRDNRLSHCVFQTTDEIVDTCCDALNWLARPRDSCDPARDHARDARQINRVRHFAAADKLDPDLAQKFLRFVISEFVRRHEANLAEA